MTTNVPLFTISTFNCRVTEPNFIQFNCISRFSALQRPNHFGSTSSSPLVGRPVALAPLHHRLKCVSSSASGNGNGGVRGESGGGGDGGSDGSDSKSKLLTGEAEETTTLSTDVIILNVGGMTCKGCSSSVQRILESQPQVSHASVDLASETAVVWPVAEAKITPNWREELGEALAKHLTSCGFLSKFQGQGAIGDVSS